jgi:hypothetical protein
VTSPSGTLAAYDRMARAMGAFEKTRTFAEFSSKFDYWLAGKYTMTPEEEKTPDGRLLPPFLAARPSRPSTR